MSGEKHPPSKKQKKDIVCDCITKIYKEFEVQLKKKNQLETKNLFALLQRKVSSK